LIIPVMDFAYCWIGMLLTDHKLRQAVYHKLGNITDNLSNIEFTVSHSKPDMIPKIVSYFLEEQDCLTFPAKSYAVAIIYSRLLQQYFDIPFYQSLSDPDLFADTDKFFVPYCICEARDVYDAAIVQLKQHNTFDVFDVELSQVSATIQYFNREFYITTNPYFECVLP